MKIIGNVNVLIKLELHLSLLNKLHSSIDNIYLFLLFKKKKEYISSILSNSNMNQDYKIIQK